MGGVVGWFVGRRKQNVEADAGELENVKTSLGIYREIITDLQNKVTQLSQSHQQFITDNDTLRKELRTAHSENNGLRKRITALEKEIEQLKKNSQ